MMRNAVCSTLEQESIRIALSRNTLLRIISLRTVLQEEFAYATSFLNGRIEVDIGIKQSKRVVRHTMRGSAACGKMTLRRTWFARHVMRAATLHFLVAPALFPACHTYFSLFARRQSVVARHALVNLDNLRRVDVVQRHACGYTRHFRNAFLQNALDAV